MSNEQRCHLLSMNNDEVHNPTSPSPTNRLPSQSFIFNRQINSQAGSVPNSPLPKTKQYVMSSTPGTPQIYHRTVDQQNYQLQRSKRSKKPKTPARTTSLNPAHSTLRYSLTDSSSTTLKQSDSPISSQKLLTKKSDCISTTNRLSILQRIFGMKDTTTNTTKNIPQSPKLTTKVKTSTPTRPSTVGNESVLSQNLLTHTSLTLDLQNILPLSSTLSSGRASSSGYESMNNRDSGSGSSHNDSAEDSSSKTRSKSARKSDERRSNNNTNNSSAWSPRLNNMNGIRTSKTRDKIQTTHAKHQQQSQLNRIQSLKQRQDELKLELAMTKTFFLIDNNQQWNYNASNISSNMNDEDVLEKEIELLEKRLVATKSHLMFSTSFNDKQTKS
ncbi:unnamed protein product [Didymodactylos carnosus]|uniref:Uncharacterized protein n=1 Tax=Didymodactylos carnosus TaxID=1234261 RepID=A0A8S2CXK2_9BILA|nr:unnamed protein product [Didymodactylos carnosus]CAF3613954.1 unnamed protein product [Didymodactylos carnosus]